MRIQCCPPAPEMYLNQRPLYDAVSLTGRVHGFKHQGTEVGVALLTITPGDPLGQFVLLVHVILGSRSL